MKRQGRPLQRDIERYGTTPEGFPIVEIAHWRSARPEEPEGVTISGMGGHWLLLAVESPLAQISLYEKYGVLNLETGFKELVIPPDADYWDYYKQPLKEGITLEYDFDRFLAKLKAYEARMEAGDYAAYNAMRVAAQADYERLLADQWSPELASKLSGYIPKGSTDVVSVTDS